MEEHSGSAESLSHALLEFVAAVGVGLTGATLSGLRGRLGATVDGRRIGKNQVTWLNAFEPIYARPDHIGVSEAMKRIRDAPPAGYTVRLHGNVWALCNLGRTDDPRRHLSSLGRFRRARQLPAQAVSMIHKAKGLEFNHVLLCPVDRHQFPNGPLGARLLYVAKVVRAGRSELPSQPMLCRLTFVSNERTNMETTLVDIRRRDRDAEGLSSSER